MYGEKNGSINRAGPLPRPEAVPILCKVYEKVDGENLYSHWGNRESTSFHQFPSDLMNSLLNLGIFWVGIRDFSGIFWRCGDWHWPANMGISATKDGSWGLCRWGSWGITMGTNHQKRFVHLVNLETPSWDPRCRLLMEILHRHSMVNDPSCFACLEGVTNRLDRKKVWAPARPPQQKCAGFQK